MKRLRHHSLGAIAGAVCAGLLVVLLATSAGAQSAPPSTPTTPTTTATTPTTKPAAPKTQAEGPGAPTITKVTVGNEKATVTWKGSTKAGAPAAVKYEVTPFRGTAAQRPVTVDAPATTATVTGLHNKAKYTFKVAAIDAAGAKSKESIASKAVTPTSSGLIWYKSKRVWAGVLVVIAALVAGGVFLFRRQKKTAPTDSSTSSTAPPDAEPTEPSMPQEA